MPLSDPRREKQLHQFIQRLGLPKQAPVRWDLLDLALTHPTASATANYERLEFVGDAVVKLAAAEFLFTTYPNASDGELSALRSVMVSDRLLAQIADQYGFDRFLLMANSALADRVGQETRLAAAFEAVLAALYLSTQNLSLIAPWLEPHLYQSSEMIRQDPALHNYKGALQGWTQAHHQSLPEYRVQEVGQVYGDTERFVAEVWLQGKRWGEGKGQSKKAAEQSAARVAFLALKDAFESKE
ncbi:ribonuclease III [Egbenema bharatensis]|uniref:ribonuclease III n=1 Tax=Egbenema bharatensis TaxID=3463334 RepID=UPI003A8AE5F6